MLNYRPFSDLKPNKKEPLVDKKKREKFEKKFTCKSCKQPLVWIEDTNVMSCQNPKCKGTKRKKILADGTEEIYYIPFNMILGNYDRRLAERLQGEKGNEEN